MELDHVVVYVTDFERALTFYRDTFGFRELFRDGDIADLEAGAGRVLLHGDDGTPKPPLPSFRVDSIDAAIVRLRERGLVVPDAVDEGWGRVTRFDDPSGNPLCVFERNPH